MHSCGRAPYTVDGCQGKEGDYVIVSTRALNDTLTSFFAQEPACVAMIRGKWRLIILGNRQNLERNTLWSGPMRFMVSVDGNFCSLNAAK